MIAALSGVGLLIFGALAAFGLDLSVGFF